MSKRNNNRKRLEHGTEILLFEMWIGFGNGGIILSNAFGDVYEEESPATIFFNSRASRVSRKSIFQGMLYYLQLLKGRKRRKIVEKYEKLSTKTFLSKKEELARFSHGIFKL